MRTKGDGPNDYLYVIIQPAVWAPLAVSSGGPTSPSIRIGIPRGPTTQVGQGFALIEDWSQRHSKFDAMEALNSINVPCGPVLGTKELIEDQSLADLGAIVSVEHPERGTFKTVGSPLRLSDSPVEVERPPLLGSTPNRSVWSSAIHRRK